MPPEPVTHNCDTCAGQKHHQTKAAGLVMHVLAGSKEEQTTAGGGRRHPGTFNSADS